MPVTMPLAERERLAEDIRVRMASEDYHSFLVLYEPGDATFYQLLFADARVDVPIVSTMYAPARTAPRLGGREVRWVVSWIGKGTSVGMPFGPEHFWHPTWVQSSFAFDNEHSAVVLAELFSMIGQVDRELLDSMRETYHWVWA